jgi:hypothetical protein
MMHYNPELQRVSAEFARQAAASRTRRAVEEPRVPSSGVSRNDFA